MMELLNAKQRIALKKLWFVYGNGGPKSTLLNHKYIQGLLEYNEDRKKDYLEGNVNMIEKGFERDCLTDECMIEVEKILNSN